MSKKIQILKDRLLIITDPSMRNHIRKIIKELESEPREPLDETPEAEALDRRY